MRFAYQVRNSSGEMFKGFLEGENKGVVIESLINQDLNIILLQEVKESKHKLDLFLEWGKVPGRDIVLITRQMATMLGAGLSILRCLSILAKQNLNPKLKKALMNISADIESGSALWQAMAKHPTIFSSVYVSMIKAGEIGGVLDIVLEKLALYLEKEQEITTKIKSAMAYPVFISVFTVMVIVFIISYVMPTFVRMFTSLGVELPLPTQIMLRSGLFVRQNWMLLLIGIALIIIVIRKWRKTRQGRYILDYIYLKLPFISKVLSKVIVARFARTMGTLIKSGIPVAQSLKIVEEITGNTFVAKALYRARRSINEGDSITIPLENTGVFEPMVCHMIAVGEETGALDEMLVRVSDYYEQEVTYTVDGLMSLIEPLLILIVAVIVGGVVVAVILPVFEIMNTIGIGM